MKLQLFIGAMALMMSGGDGENGADGARAEAEPFCGVDVSGGFA